MLYMLHRNNSVVLIFHFSTDNEADISNLYVQGP